MLFGIIAEGIGDQAVIKNVLSGLFKGQDYEISYIRPSNNEDETDKNASEKRFSNWTLVKKECIERIEIKSALDSEDTIVILHLDAQERNEKGYDVNDLPNLSSKEDCSALRKAIKEKMTEWMGGFTDERLVFAIAVEETDAWVIPLYEENLEETGTARNPKEKLRNIILKKFSQKQQKEMYDTNKQEKETAYNRSKGLSKNKILTKVRSKNQSLDEFCTNIETAVKSI